MRHASKLTLVALALVALACSSSKGSGAYGESEEKLQIDVTVTYLEKMMLPPQSTIRAALYDESHELKPAISSKAVTTHGGPSVPVELEILYPMDQLDDSHEYVVRAEITDPQGKLLFVTEEPVQVMTNQQEPQKIEIVLKRAG